jgi:hypothetical protein
MLHRCGSCKRRRESADEPRKKQTGRHRPNCCEPFRDCRNCNHVLRTQYCFEHHVFFYKSMQSFCSNFSEQKGHEMRCTKAIRSLTESRSGSGKLMYRILCRPLESETRLDRQMDLFCIVTTRSAAAQRRLQGMMQDG